MNLSRFKKLTTPYVLILIGPPLVGKTYFCNRFISEIDDGVDIISRDKILLDVYGGDDYNDAFRNVDQKLVTSELDSKMKSCATSKDNVIVDMTNLTSKRRKYTLSYFRDHTKIAVIFPPIEWDEMQKRNTNRQKIENKTIPDHVIKSMMSSYQPISDDEGFDKIISI